MDLGPGTLGFKDTQLLTLQERGGPRSNPLICAFLPNHVSVSFFMWAGNTERFMAKKQEKSHVSAAWFSVLGLTTSFLLFIPYIVQLKPLEAQMKTRNTKGTQRDSESKLTDKQQTEKLCFQLCFQKKVHPITS